MSRVRQLGRFLYDFVIGDDWRLAGGAALALALAGVVSRADESAWWVAPPVIAFLLGVIVLRARPRSS